MKRVSLFFILLILYLASCAEPPLVDDGDGPAAPSVEPNAQSEQTEEKNAHLLIADDLIDISVSAPEGSGSIRTLTIRYVHDGKEECATIDNVKRIDLKAYDGEKKEQTFTVSDYDGDGIFDIIVYREFWFPDIKMAHAGIPSWPTVYEYDTEKGFIITSSKHKDYFETYIKASEEQLAEFKEHMEDDEKLALRRLIYAAGQIVNGSFTPESQYKSKYYEDVYELTKDIDELTGFYYI